MKTVNKYFPFTFLVIFFFFTSAMFGQQNFEGKITIDVMGLANGEISYYVKGDKIRMNVEGKQRNSDIIIDPDKKEMFLLLTQMNKYIEIPFNNPAIQKFKKEIHPDSESGKNPEFTNTGKTKVINGFKCEKWNYKDSKINMSVWLSSDLGGFRFFKNPMIKKDESLWKRTIESTGKFPIKIDVIKNNGDSMTMLEVKDAKKMKLNASYFQPPEDFEKMPMPHMNSIRSLMQKK